MRSNKYSSVSEVAKALGISRIAVYKKIKKGKIKAIRIGKQFAIPNKYLSNLSGMKIKYSDKMRIKKAVKKTVEQYGETLRLLGRE